MPRLFKLEIPLKHRSLNLCWHHLSIVFVIILGGCVDELFIIEESLLSKNDLKPIAGHYFVPTLDNKYATLKIGAEILKHAYAVNKTCDALDFKYGFGESKPLFTGIACFSRLPESDLVIMATPGEKTKSYDEKGNGAVLGEENNPFVLMRFDGDQLEIWTWDKNNPLVAQTIDSSRSLQKVHAFLSNNWQKYIAEQTKITFSRSTKAEEKTIESLLAAELKQQQLLSEAKKHQESKLKLEKELADLKSPNTPAIVKTSEGAEKHDTMVTKQMKIIEVHKPMPRDLDAPLFTIETDSATAAMLKKHHRPQFLSEHTKLLAGKLNLVAGKPESREVSIYASMPHDNIRYVYSLFLYEAESDCTFPFTSPYPTERSKLFWQASVNYLSNDQISKKINIFSSSDKSTQWKAWPETGKCKPELSMVKPEPATETILDFVIRSPSEVELEISKKEFFSSERKPIGNGSFTRFERHDSLFSSSVPTGGLDDPDGHYFVSPSIVGKIKVVGMNLGDYQIEITQVHATDWSRLRDGETFASGFWKPGYQRLVFSENDRTEHCGIVRSELISMDFIPARLGVHSESAWQLKKNINDDAICKVRRLVDCKVDGCLKWSTHEDFSNTSTYIAKIYETAQTLFNDLKKINKSMMPLLR